MAATKLSIMCCSPPKCEIQGLILNCFAPLKPIVKHPPWFIYGWSPKGNHFLEIKHLFSSNNTIVCTISTLMSSQIYYYCHWEGEGGRDVQEMIWLNKVKNIVTYCPIKWIATISNTHCQLCNTGAQNVPSCIDHVHYSIQRRFGHATCKCMSAADLAQWSWSQDPLSQTQVGHGNLATIHTFLTDMSACFTCMPSLYWLLSI